MVCNRAGLWKVRWCECHLDGTYWALLECVPYSKTTRVIAEQRIQVPNLPPPLQSPLFNSGTLGISKLDDILHPIEMNDVHPPGSSSPIGAAHTIAACLRASLHAFSASLCRFPFRSSFLLHLWGFCARFLILLLILHELSVFWTDKDAWRGRLSSLVLFLFLLVWIGKRRRFLSSVPAKSDGVMEDSGGRCVPNIFWRLRCGNDSVCSFLMRERERERERERFSSRYFLVNVLLILQNRFSFVGLVSICMQREAICVRRFESARARRTLYL